MKRLNDIEGIPCSECGERANLVVMVGEVAADANCYAMRGIPEIRLCPPCIWKAWQLLNGNHDVDKFYKLVQVEGVE